MPIARSEFQVPISMPLDASGAQQAAQELNRLSHAAGEAGEKMEVSERKLISFLRQAGAGPLAELIHMGGGPLLIGAGVLEVYEQIQKKKEMIHEENVKLIEDEEKIKERQEATAAVIQNKLSDSLHAAQLHIEHLHDSYMATEKIAERLAVHANNLAAAMERSAAAEFTMAEAKVRGQQASGAMSDLEAEARIAQIQLDAEKKKDELENKRLAEESYRDMAQANREQREADAARGRADNLRTGPAAEVNAAIQTAIQNIATQKDAHDEAVKFRNESAAVYRDKTNGMSEEEIAAALNRSHAGAGSFGDMAISRARRKLDEDEQHVRETSTGAMEAHLEDLKRQQASIDRQIAAQDSLADAQDALAQKHRDAMADVDQTVHDNESSQRAGYREKADINQQNLINALITKSRQNFPEADHGQGAAFANRNDEGRFQYTVAQATETLTDITQKGVFIPKAALDRLLKALNQIPAATALQAQTIDFLATQLENLQTTVRARGSR